MSGGVGPTGGDISLPKEEEEKEVDHPFKAPQAAARRRRFFSFSQLNALAVIVVFSASGMVAPEDLAFFLFSLAYVNFLSRVAFPAAGAAPEPPVFGEKNRVLGLYVLAGAAVGLFLPIAYIFEGIFEGDKEGIKAAAPHVFLLAAQVFVEGVTSSSSSARFSLPIRAFVPIFYNTKRMFTIVDWVRGEVWKAEEGEHGSARRLHVGRGLAVANLVFWAFNLFGFLLPVYLPRAFKRYYGPKVKA